MTSDESKVTCSSQTHRGLDIELSLLPFPEPGLLARVGLRVLTVAALPDSVALAPSLPSPDVVPLLQGLVGIQNHGRGEGAREEAFTVVCVTQLFNLTAVLRDEN